MVVMNTVNVKKRTTFEKERICTTLKRKSPDVKLSQKIKLCNLKRKKNGDLPALTATYEFSILPTDVNLL
jgi:hypothetical protein